LKLSGTSPIYVVDVGGVFSTSKISTGADIGGYKSSSTANDGMQALPMILSSTYRYNTITWNQNGSNTTTVNQTVNSAGTFFTDGIQEVYNGQCPN